MKFKSVLILFIILIAIAAYFFLFEERRRKTEERAEQESRELVPYGPSEVEKIVLFNPDGDRIEMERRGDDWLITSPTVTKGAGSTIDILLKQLVPGRKLEEFRNIERLSDFGLNDPFATAILYSTKSQHPDTIHIGDKTPTSSKCYIRLGSSKNVVITREMTHNVMNKNLYHLRDKNFLDFNSATIDALTIKNGGLRTSLVKKDNTWWIAERGFRADGFKIERYLIMLTQAIIREFVSEDIKELNRYGLEEPEKTITIRREEDTTKILFGLKRNGMVHVFRSDLDKVLLVEESLLSIFDLEEKDIRARDLTFFDTNLVKGIRYETEDTTVVIRMQNGEWIVQGDDRSAIKPAGVTAFFRALKEIKYEEFLDGPAAVSSSDYAPFALRLELEDGEGNIIESIGISSPFADYEIGTSRSSNATGKLKKHTLNDIERRFIQLGAGLQ